MRRSTLLETVRGHNLGSLACKPFGGQPNPPIGAPDGAPVHDESHRPEQTTLYRLVQQPRRMAQTVAHLVDQVITRVPVRQWVRVCQVRLPIPLLLLLAAQPKPVTPVLQVVYRAITRFMLDQAGLKAEQAEQADSGAC